MGGMSQQQGYAAPYLPPVDPRFAAVVAPGSHRRPTPRLGRVALVLSIGAVLIAAVPMWLAGYASGSAIAASDFLDSGVWAWSILSPVRAAVVGGETAFWIGTALGAWGLVQGIVAVRTRRGRTPGIWAIAIAASSPVLLAVLTGAALTIGVEAA